MTNLRTRQRGMSSVGWIFVAGIFGFLVITFFKIYPMFYENFKLKSSLESLQHDTSIDPKSKSAIWNSLKKRLYINEVRFIRLDNITMQRKDGKTTVTVSYETRQDYIANLFIGGRFVETIVIDR